MSRFAYNLIACFVLLFYVDGWASDKSCVCPASILQNSKDLSSAYTMSAAVFQGVIEDVVYVNEYDYVAKVRVVRKWKDGAGGGDGASGDGQDGVAGLREIFTDFFKHEDIAGGDDAANKRRMDQSIEEKLLNQEVKWVLSTDNPADCGFPLRVGGGYLLYADWRAEGVLQVSRCSRSGFSHALEGDIIKLNELQRSIAQQSAVQK